MARKRASTAVSSTTRRAWARVSADHCDDLRQADWGRGGPRGAAPEPSAFTPGPPAPKSGCHRFSAFQGVGQAVMRGERLETVPDPLRSNLRTLMALAGGRYAFIPASVEYGRDEEGASRVTLVAVLADTRTGAVAWRSKNAVGTGARPADALKAAVVTFLPDMEKPIP